MTGDNIIRTDFMTDDELPVPEKVARHYGFKLEKREIDGVRWYAVVDWIEGVAMKSDVRKMWSAMKQRVSQLSTACRQFDYRAKNGKTFQMDFATDEALYMITQRMESNSGRRDEVLLYLAKAGVALDEMIRDPERAEQLFAEWADEKEYRRLIKEGHSDQYAKEFVAQRRALKLEWNKLRAEWKARGIESGFEYGRLTNDVNMVALGRTATKDKRDMNISTTPRDEYSPAENAMIEITSSLSRTLHTSRDSQGVDELSQDIKDVKPLMDSMRDQAQKLFSTARRRRPLPPKNEPPKPGA